MMNRIFDILHTDERKESSSNHEPGFICRMKNKRMLRV